MPDSTLTTIYELENQLGNMVIRETALAQFRNIINLWGDEFGWDDAKRRHIYRHHVTSLVFVPDEIPEDEYLELLHDFQREHPPPSRTQR